MLRDGRSILSNVIGSQVAVHKKYGGVVPELASRHHLENIVPIVNAAFQEARSSAGGDRRNRRDSRAWTCRFIAW